MAQMPGFGPGRLLNQMFGVERFPQSGRSYEQFAFTAQIVHD
jgi:hypothetical protein